jgi:hypothetical protein
VPAQQVAGLPPFFTLENGYIVRVTAQSPTDGSTVTGVIVSNVSLAVDQEDAATPEPDQKPGPVFLIPGPAMLT